MGRESDRIVAEGLAGLFRGGTVAGLTDGQLLERSSDRGGEGAELAFSALVERHGPMVLRTCRNILGRGLDPQDAFQATFLILVRRAGSLRVRDSLGPWLHRVACRVAIRARRAEDRRRAVGGRAGRPLGLRAGSRRGGGLAPRGDRPAPRAVPPARRALRPGRGQLRSGCPSARLPGRDGQEPALPGP